MVSHTSCHLYFVGFGVKHIWFIFYECFREKKVKVVGRKKIRRKGIKRDGGRGREKTVGRRKVGGREEEEIPEVHVGSSDTWC